MLRCLNLLLLLCLVNHSGTPPVETHPNSVEGKKGGSVTLQCELEDNTIIYLLRRSKSILDCQNEKCENKTENVQGICKAGSCDMTIKNLCYSDAGKYILRFSHPNKQTEVQQKTYQLHIYDEISMKIGEELKLDVLSNADKVQHQNKSSTEWTDVWSTSDGVQSQRLSDTDGNLTINNFTASDAGTYRVIDSNREILITLTVTESTESKEELGGREQHNHWSVPVGVCSGVLALIVITVIIWQLWHRGNIQGNPEAPAVLREPMMVTEHDQNAQGPLNNGDATGFLTCLQHQ